jgi:hypothetical protein
LRISGLKAECTHVETGVVWVLVLGSPHEVRRSLDASCPTCREVCQTLATFWSMGLGERPSSARACVSLLPVGRTFGRGLDFGIASLERLTSVYNRINL